MPEETRERIVEAAYQVLAREGYDATSVKDIAAAAGVAPGLVHYYFKTKEDLVLAAIAWACRDHAQPEGGSPEEQALNAFARSKAELSGPREFQRLLFDMFGVGMHNAAVADALRRFVREDRTQIERLAREVLAQRRTRSPENRGPREIADFVGIEEDRGCRLGWDLRHLPAVAGRPRTRRRGGHGRVRPNGHDFDMKRP